jgi:hypothetical protein
MKAWEVDRMMGNVTNDTPDWIDTKTEKDERAPGLIPAALASTFCAKESSLANISVVTGRLSQSASYAWGAEALSPL